MSKITSGLSSLNINEARSARPSSKNKLKTHGYTLRLHYEHKTQHYKRSKKRFQKLCHTRTMKMFCYHILVNRRSK